MAMDFIVIRHNIVSRETFEIAADYICSELLFDLVATLPSLISNHSNKLMFLRLFHIIHLKKASFILKIILETLIPFSRIVRNQINVSIKITFLILLGSHFCVILWLFAG
jgi:hypothetical protein